MLEPSDDDAKLRHFLDNPLEKEAPWALVEVWRHWQSTLCCSYFIADGQTPPIVMEACQQLFEATDNRFIGRRSFTDLVQRQM